ncbi:hypothetical protein M222_1445 [Enterococcus faecalis AZ19]|nr:hypothetical protein M222_1445 [Enterococcus faecalis AZ19]
MERALEGVVFCFPRNTADDPNIKNNMTQDNTNRLKKEKIQRLLVN